MAWIVGLTSLARDTMNSFTMREMVERSHANEEVFPSYNAGLIVLSYVISFVGCATALELLHRRTSRFGLYNWYAKLLPKTYRVLLRNI